MKIYFKKYFPIIVLIVLSLIPIVRWSFLEPISFRYADFNSTMTSLGQITGLLGMTLFALNLIISNRSIFLDKFFSGLHHLYDTHKWLGSLSFSLLLFHPLFLVTKYISISVYQAAMFLLPGENFAITMGIIALLGMIVLLSITLYFKIKYHIWKFSHKFMVLVFIFAILHILFISSDISRDIFLRNYILFLSILGLLSGLYRSFFRTLYNNDFNFVVKKVSILNENVVEIELEPIEKNFIFLPGQFIFVSFDSKGVSSESHPFSISSAVVGENLKITVKALGDFTNTLKSLKVGAKAKIEGPFGEFFNNRKNKKEIWLAGGVGITPFLSLTRSLKDINNDIYLFYCLNDASEAVDLEELKNISFNKNRFHLITWYSKDRGRINTDAIEKLSNGISHTDIYICGPLVFMKSLKGQFINKGVDKNNINFEEFNFL